MYLYYVGYMFKLNLYFELGYTNPPPLPLHQALTLNSVSWILYILHFISVLIIDIYVTTVGVSGD